MSTISDSKGLREVAQLQLDSRSLDPLRKFVDSAQKRKARGRGGLPSGSRLPHLEIITRGCPPDSLSTCCCCSLVFSSSFSSPLSHPYPHPHPPHIASSSLTSLARRQVYKPSLSSFLFPPLPLSSPPPISYTYLFLLLVLSKNFSLISLPRNNLDRHSRGSIPSQKCSQAGGLLCTTRHWISRS